MRTLLLFAKAPEPGRVKTRLAPELGPEGACRVYRALVADLALALTALPDTRVVWSVDGDPAGLRPLLGAGATVEPQPGGDLGERLEAAMAAAFARDGGPVAVAGTDCPLLGPAEVDALFAAAEGAGAALIPAEDGGYVALALAAPSPDAFRAIPWSTPAVLAATRAALTAVGRPPVLLPPLWDVDEAPDLARLAALLARTPRLAPHTARLLAEGLA